MERQLDEALSRSETLGLRPDAARCRLSLGVLHARTGRRELADAELETALAMFRQMQIRYWVDTHPVRCGISVSVLA